MNKQKNYLMKLSNVSKKSNYENKKTNDHNEEQLILKMELQQVQL